MKQILQDLKSGQISMIDAPIPQLDHGQLLIRTTTTLISAGTERMLMDFGKASYLNKARQQPEKVKMVKDKIKTDGLLTTLEAVRSKLEQPLPLGYCHVGIVERIGFGVDGLKPGDRVVSNGFHADLVKVAKHLCAKIPDTVDDETAAFTALASIGLQGIRLANLTIGESVAVIGVGLIGLLTVQLLKAHGCRVLAIDFDAHKLALARQFGAQTCQLEQGDDPVARGLAFSHGHGMDAVLITAATQSNDPVTLGARMSRKRGRIVLVGVAGLALNRADFYEKELSFQVSCSYGPGRYDANYESKGLDYPIGFVRWTEQRNFEACLELMAEQRMDVKPLISHRYLFEDADEAYNTLINDASTLGILLHYQSDIAARMTPVVPLNQSQTHDTQKPMIGFIGAGQYASRTLLPAFSQAKAQLHSIVTAGGINGVIQGKKAGFIQAISDVNAIFDEKNINTLVIATRHNTHAQLVCKALRAGKNVFVEKPIALRLDELAEIEAAYHTAVMTGRTIHLMVGFNRRFAPQIQKMKWLLDGVKEPKTVMMTVNAGQIPMTHWSQDKLIGGGRIVGEACHFIDLMRHLIGCDVVSTQVQRLGTRDGEDKAAILLGFADGSWGTIHYLANGSTAFPKERIEVFAAGKVIQLNNFRTMRGYNWPGFQKMNLWRQNKGQKECVAHFLQSIEKGLETPIPIQEIFEVARVSIQVAELIRQ